MATNERDSKDQWMKEYAEFARIEAQAIAPSAPVARDLRARLFPSPWLVLGKVTALHTVAGFLSLGICHQFGLNPFGTQVSLADWFMNAGGHHFCMFACGVVFMATTYLFAGLVLSLEEFETVRRFEWLQTSIVGLVSLAAFHFFGAELVALFAALWFMGALVGGLISIEGSHLLLRRLVHARV